MSKLGGDGDRFGDYLRVDYTNLLCINRHIQITNLKCTRGALHKIGRFRNVPTVGTFVNTFNFNFINKRTYGRYVSETTYFM